MLSKYFWAAACVLLFSSACQRRNHLRVCPRIKTIFNTSAGYTSTYYYTSDGRLYMVSTSLPAKTTYRYSSNTITGKTVDSSGRMTGGTLCYLNVSGLVDSMVSMDSSRVAFTKKYLYDADGFVSEERMYTLGRLSSVTRNAIRDGNIVSFAVVHFLAKAGVNFNEATGRYDTTLVYVPGNEYNVYTVYDLQKLKTLTFENYGFKEFGKGSRNIELATIQVSSSGDTIDVSHYNYTFDRDKRISSYAIHSMNTDMFDSSSVTYY